MLTPNDIEKKIAMLTQINEQLIIWLDKWLASINGVNKLQQCNST